MKELSFTEALVEPSTLFICATSRLALDVRRRHALDMHTAGHGVSPAVNAKTLDQWLADLLEQLSLLGVLEGTPHARVSLTSEQALLIWEQVIRQALNEQQRLLFDLPNLARTAHDAYELVVVWGVDPDTSYASEETKAYLRWQQRFEERCQQLNSQTKFYLQRAFVADFARFVGQLALPKRVAFAGYARFDPIELALQQALIDAGVDVVQVDMTRQDVTPQLSLASYPDQRAEALAAALWAQEQLNSSPDSRIAIVVPDLEKSRDVLHDALDDVLLPQGILASHADKQRPFNISLGLPLLQYPMVSTAFKLWQLMMSTHEVKLAEVSALLRDPWWSFARQEAVQRAQADALLRRRAVASGSLAYYLRAAVPRASPEQDSPSPLQQQHWYRHAQALVAARSQYSEKQLPSQWAATLLSALDNVGWLAERTLSSSEYQTKRRFAEAMYRLNQFDELLGVVGFQQVVALARRISQRTIFQPQTEGHPRINVLGLLEMSGLQADAVWVMGLIDSAWPMPARPNPLLPSTQQRALACPGASASVQLAFAQRVQAHLFACAADIRLSWPRQEGATALEPSAILPPQLMCAELPSPVTPHWARQAAMQAGQALAEGIADDQAQPVLPNEHVSGGAGLLKAQAVCPAWAYFQYRLHATALKNPEEGIDAADKGTIVHAVLEMFWREVKDSRTLHSLGEQGLLEHCQTAIARGLAQFEQYQGKTFSPRQRQLEVNSLQRLLTQWLEQEKKRPSAFQVIALEREIKPILAGIEMKTIVDRIDQLDDGGCVVIDYKTGSNIDTKNWASPRLTSPQLPLYATLATDEQQTVAGVAFAKVRMDECKWAGLLKDDGVLPDVEGLEASKVRRHFPEEVFADWDAVLLHWRQALQSIAEEVRDGKAWIIADNVKDLEYCDVKPLLRLAEREQQWRSDMRALVAAHKAGGAA